jgi:hypothetical protein
MSAARDHRIILLVALAWLAVVGAGIAFVTRYSGTPGVQAAAPERWPADSAVERATDRPTLVMLAHPRCACTRATLGELAALMERVGDRVSARVLFVEPEGVEATWTQTDLWRSAAAIPGVEVIRDVHGAEAHRFGAETSGQALVYDASGRLVYRGGLTPARGHPGTSTGRDQLAALILGQKETSAPVFGCPLNDPKQGRVGL